MAIRLSVLETRGDVARCGNATRRTATIGARMAIVADPSPSTEVE